MLKRYDIVELLVAKTQGDWLDGEPGLRSPDAEPDRSVTIPAGATGTVLEVLSDGSGCTVEFLNSDGSMLALSDVRVDELRVVDAGGDIHER
jgi:hypothetical protein